MLRMASRVGEWKSIIDVGCGNQQLREIVENLYPEAQYTGVDQHSHRKDTLIADFNKGEYPNVTADLVVVSGVLEYVLPTMLDDFLDSICGTAPLVALSYFPTDYDSVYINKRANPAKKRSELWVNQLKLIDIIGLFGKRNFQVEILKRYKTSSQYVMIFKKEST